eukprot:TRINITY_DN5434_c1_g2_i2.p1 TRINITY_DN5434_c1_g2~~TRINITY_DN5434_c1_g2_i2.p1  ORF type:complete len:457 (-),score=40.78 TRINITY_DN5434_c1_g2_i2:23-1393(-)
MLPSLFMALVILAGTMMMMMMALVHGAAPLITSSPSGRLDFSCNNAVFSSDVMVGNTTSILTLHNKITQIVSDPTLFNVRDFGAKGDSIADDYPAFNKAIAAMQASPYDQPTLYIPAGNYWISQVLVFPSINPKRYQIVGQGKRSTNLLWEGESLFSLMTTTYIYSVRFENFMTTALTTEEETFAIRITRCLDCVFRNLFFEQSGPQYSMGIESTKAYGEQRFEDVTFYNIGGKHLQLIDSTGATYITRCTFIAGAESVEDWGAISLAGMESVYISQCDFVAGSWGVWIGKSALGSNKYVTISDCIMQRTFYGIYILDSSSITITNVQIIDHYESGISSWAPTDVPFVLLSNVRFSWSAAWTGQGLNSDAIYVYGGNFIIDNVMFSNLKCTALLVRGFETLSVRGSTFMNNNKNFDNNVAKNYLFSSNTCLNAATQPSVFGGTPIGRTMNVGDGVC